MKTITAKKIYSFILIIIGMFSLSFVSAQSPGSVQTINPIIGDISFVVKYGYQPDETTSEDLRIQTHLEYAENLLRQKDVADLSPEGQQKRTRLLDLLHDYWTAGKFPRNYDYTDVRKPCFIDKDNTICAVGYLIEKTAGRQAAEAINNKYKYAFVMEMNDALVESWIASSGLSKEECAIIQPDYGWGWPTCSGNKVYACRYSCCIQECKCVNANNVAQWEASGKPCGGNGNGNGGPCKMGQADETTSIDIYPNPASTTSTISFYLSEECNVAIDVYDLNGQLIANIAHGEFPDGSYEMKWNVDDVGAGIYFLRIQAANYSENRKLIVMK